MRAFLPAAVLALISAGVAFAPTGSFAQTGSTTDTTVPMVPPALAPAVAKPSAGNPAAANPVNASTMPPAVALSSAASKTAAAPVPGANSFTETEARNRIQSFGYSSVGPLVKDDQSIWRGKATKDGKSVDVALDYQGNVVGE